jgi:hypothetical protein
MSKPPLGQIFRSKATRQIDSQITQICDTDNPVCEGHSLHAVPQLQKHYMLAPFWSNGIVVPRRYVCIWSTTPGLNTLSNPDLDVRCLLYHCYFPVQFTGMHFIFAGVFGSAYRAVWNRDDGSAPVNVVIKRIDLRKIPSSDIVLVLREKMLLQRLNHERISSILLQYNDPSDSDIVYFVLEDGGPSTLDNFIRDAINSAVPIMPSTIKIIMEYVSLLHDVERASTCLPVAS